jgi:hypothetical protein
MLSKYNKPYFEYISHTSSKEHKVWRFDSDWGVSAVKGKNVRGSSGEDWAVAVIRFSGPEPGDFDIDYDNPLSRELNDVFLNVPDNQIPALVELVSQLK